MTESGCTQNRSETTSAGLKAKMISSSDDEEEGYVSPYNYCSSEEDNDQSNRQLLDELPVFSTQSLSPSGRSLSPIDMDTSPPRSSRGNSTCHTPCDDSPYSQTVCGKDYVTLEEIQARIGMTPPPSVEPEQTGRSPRLNLETIFEDKCLETPPKAGGKEFDARTNQNLLRRSFRNRAQQMGAAAAVAMGTEVCESISPIQSLSEQFSNKVVLN